MHNQTSHLSHSSTAWSCLDPNNSNSSLAARSQLAHTPRAAVLLDRSLCPNLRSLAVADLAIATDFPPVISDDYTICLLSGSSRKSEQKKDTEIIRPARRLVPLLLVRLSPPKRTTPPLAGIHPSRRSPFRPPRPLRRPPSPRRSLNKLPTRPILLPRRRRRTTPKWRI